MHYQYTDNLSEEEFEEFEEELGEMYHFSKKYSKLPYRILMDYDGKNRKRKDNSPRIMISLDNHCRNIAPGMNEDRKEFNRIINLVLENKVNKIFITYKDRFTRFGFKYFENICKKI